MVTNIKVFTMTKKFNVYYLLDENHQSFYIGKGNDRRLTTTIIAENNNPLKKNKIAKIRKITGKDPEVRVLLIGSEEYCFNIEKKLIKFYGRRDLGTGILCNMTDGGEGASGTICSEETREFYRKWMKEHNPMNNPEYREKVSQSKLGNKNPMFGKKITEETRLKRSKSLSGPNSANFGKHLSAETRKKISETLRGRKPTWTDQQRTQEHINNLKISCCKTLYRITNPNGNIIETKLLMDFCRSNNLNQGHMYSVSRGERDNHKGYRVIKVENI